MKVCLLSLFLLLTCAFAQENTAQIKQSALESARAVLARPTYGYPPAYLEKSCSPKAKRLYPGKPVFVHSLIHPMSQDRQRLQRRIAEARRKQPDFVFTPQDDFYNWDAYRVSIFDRTCGYVFHVELSTNKKGTFRVGGPLQLPRQKARRYLASAASPTLVGGLGFSPEKYMWVAGSKAVGALGKPGGPTVYRIVDTSGKPVSPLETNLKLHILWQPFTLTDGTPSAFSHFYLPVRLEPSPETNPR